MTRTRLMIGTAIASALLAACGVPTSDSARSIPDHQVPFHLLSPTTSSTTTTQPAAAYVSESISLGTPRSWRSIATWWSPPD